jgi:hypothetical protein
MKKVLVLIVVTLCSFTANSALSDTINLLSIWEADKNNSLGGVDIDGDGSIDQHYGVCVPSCQVTAGSIAQITSVAFWQGGSANDHRTPDMQNMLAFEGIALGGLDKTLENSPANTTSLLSSIDFSGYITVKAAGSVWLYFVEDMDSNGVSISLGNALDGKLHNISHYSEWGIAEVPLPADLWFFIVGLAGLLGLRWQTKA